MDWNENVDAIIDRSHMITEVLSGRIGKPKKRKSDPKNARKKKGHHKAHKSKATKKEKRETKKKERRRLQEESYKAWQERADIAVVTGPAEPCEIIAQPPEFYRTSSPHDIGLIVCNLLRC